jgi:hypothetical protein
LQIAESVLTAATKSHRDHSRNIHRFLKRFLRQILVEK